MIPGYPLNLPNRSAALPEPKVWWTFLRMFPTQFCSNSKRVSKSLIFEVKNRLMSMKMAL